MTALYKACYNEVEVYSYFVLGIADIRMLVALCCITISVLKMQISRRVIFLVLIISAYLLPEKYHKNAYFKGDHLQG